MIGLGLFCSSNVNNYGGEIISAAIVGKKMV